LLLLAAVLLPAAVVTAILVEELWFRRLEDENVHTVPRRERD